MSFFKRAAYTKSEAIKWPIPNYWDVAAFLLIFSVIILLVWGAKQMTVPYQLGQSIPISLAPSNLPLYALHTVMRMFIGLFCSLIFTFIFGTWAGKSRRAERIIIPIIDVLQSVPVLSFLSITVSCFIALFRGSMWGPECAAIFAIFVAQVWNMTLSFYQSVRTVPHDLKEAARMFHLSAWQSFWRIDVPFGMPGLLWNMMMSMSGSWFFVTASEAFSVAHQSITLPGIGSYIALAILHADKTAIVYAILSMFVVILLYDQLLFRPMAQWVRKFKFEAEEDVDIDQPWAVRLFQNTVLLRYLSLLLDRFSDWVINLKPFGTAESRHKTKRPFSKKHDYVAVLYPIFLTLIIAGAFIVVSYFIWKNVTLSELKHLLFLGACTGARVMSLIFISSLIWVPVGVWIGTRPRIAGIIQPVVQFLAAFPANLAFPVVTMLIVTFKLNVEIWVSPLMVLGTQWYILFNVIAGTSALPKDLKQVAASLGVTGWLKWRKLILPSIFPYFLTGAITAAGGAWNASIVAEFVSWGVVNLHATGLGAFIASASSDGNFSQVVLGTVIMCLYVLFINRIFWRPLYNLAVRKFSFG
jgi:NitT/TauT family transport system permease protein